MTTDLADRAASILATIDDFQICLENVTPEVLAEDQVRRLVVERLFELICAAISGIPYDLKVCESQIDWRGMAALNDRLHHRYFEDNAGLLLEKAQEQFPPLRSFARRLIRENEQ